MITTTTTTRPLGATRVEVARAEDREPTWGVAGLLVLGCLDIVTGLAVTAWRAPLLVLGLAWVLGDAWAWHERAWLPAVLLLVVPLAVLALVWWRRSAWLVRLRSMITGQWFRVTVYRPRWQTACDGAGLTKRVGNEVHAPGLARHRRVGHVDRLTVRMAPGQTVADVTKACPALASTLTAHSVTAHAATRPGWVVLDVLRRDPLTGERTSTDPARLASSGPVVLGVDEHGEDFTLDPYSTPHAAMQGATRSGKSSTCYTLLGAFAHRPDVVVTGVDPSGILLDPFTTGRGAGYIATGTRPEDLDHAGRVLADLVALMDDRVRDLRAARVDKLDGHSPAVPVVWVVLEEYPGLLAAARALDSQRGAKPGDRLAPALEAAVGRLVKEGAKVGVLVLVLAQRMSAEAVKTDDRANLGLRVTLRVDNADAVGMLHDGLDRAQVDTVRSFAPGVALAEAPGTGLRRVRMHYTAYATYRARVAAGLATQDAPALGADLVGEVIPLTTTDPAPSTGDAA
ncbi:FtsK/SpoIIIE domain-containing protein [Arsenicicoccus dermatophilus]|uniref:FtsK/SpoIIIE domain-containing protein n=1 Tax=Arsenicicoccus dermatophilus TaxID=1076331 RepID=UPI003891D882